MHIVLSTRVLFWLWLCHGAAYELTGQNPVADSDPSFHPEFWFDHDFGAVDRVSQQASSRTTDVLRICAIFHNEAPYLDEWLTHHLMAGIERIDLYDHGSQDGYLETLQPYMQSGKVILRHWNESAYDVSGLSTSGIKFSVQNQAYKACMLSNYEEAEWLLFLDIDEYLFCGSRWCPGAKQNGQGRCTDWVQHTSLNTKLQNEDSKQLRITMDLRVPWFFASTQELTQREGLVAERFKTRCKMHHGRYFKHMARMRPSTPLACGHPHFCQGASSSLKRELLDIQLFVLHYATKSYEVGLKSLFCGRCLRMRV